MTDNALDVCNLQKSFKEFSLDDVSFTLPQGFIMGLVGKNGAGKTTIIKLILELLQKDDGSIRISGNDIKNNIDIKQDIAVVFDEIYFIDEWTTQDVEAAISPFYSNWNTATFHTYLERFELTGNKKISELSKGMKMKLMLAVALSHKARLLILDEPTSGLDPVARDELLDILLEYMEDERNSILFSTHITADLDKIADYLTIVEHGRIFYTGTKDALFEKYCVVKGGPEALSDEIMSKLIGIQRGPIGFSGLLDITDMNYVTSDLLSEEATIDDILIHISQEAKGADHGHN